MRTAHIGAYDDFTEVRAGGEKIALGTVSEFKNELPEDRLWTRYVVQLAAPMDPDGGRSHSLSSTRPVIAERVEFMCR